jgi:uncharacterized protein (TIGR00159 family)
MDPLNTLIAQVSSFIPSLERFFIAVEPRQIIDIGIVAVFIYLVLVFIKETKSFFIFSTVITLLTIVYLASLFQLRLTLLFFQPFLTFFILILLIVFQREIRKFFEWFSLPGKAFTRRGASRTDEVVGIIHDTVKILTQTKTGALIVFEGNVPVEHFTAGGFRVDGRISSPLLLSIFDSTSPGHDGAVIISENRLRYFGAHLPLAEDVSRINDRGTRHRAALGISEETDSLTIVVSEERGTASIALSGTLREVDIHELELTLHAFLVEKLNAPDVGKQDFWYNLLIKNWIEKALSILLAVILWIALLA